MTCGIYRLVFSNTNKVYIGQSINIEKRFLQHILSIKQGTCSNKLLAAFLEYGLPTLDILIESSAKELDVLENLAIEIFDSVNNGFNIYERANQAPVKKGVEAGNSKYSRNQLIEVYTLLAKTTKTISQIAVITLVNSATISKILNNQSHQWLAEEFPDLFIMINNNKLFRNSENNKRRAQASKVSNSAKAKGIIYPKLIDSAGNIYIVDNLADFSRNHNISKSSLHRLLHSKIPEFKGWKCLVLDEQKL